MRILHVLSLVVAIVFVVLLAGCGGGGGTPSTPQVGTVELIYTDTQRQATYTPPTGRLVNFVYAYFDNVASDQIVSASFRPLPDGKWQLDLSDSSTQFTGSAIGTFDMTVYVIVSDDTSTPVKVGPVFRLNDLSVIGNGPPPPPW